MRDDNLLFRLAFTNHDFECKYKKRKLPYARSYFLRLEMYKYSNNYFYYMYYSSGPGRLSGSVCLSVP